MTICFENETDGAIGEEMRTLFDTVIAATLDYEQCPYETEISITITDNSGIQRVNKEYRNKDAATDVLSFPLIEFSSPSHFTQLDENELDFNFDTGELLLGDILLSYEKAEQQAVDYNHSLEREVGFLLVHSMLHLLGYDHMNEEDADIMFKKQDAILEKVGLPR